MKVPFKNIDELSKAVEAGEINTLKKAVKAKCLDCSCYNSTEVRECPVKNCPLYAFRNGKNPYRKKRDISEEERQQLAERMRKNIHFSK